MTQIAYALLAAITAALTAFPVDVAHHHCDKPEDPLCVPKGAVEDVVANRGEFPRERCAPGEDGGVVCTG